MQNELLLKELTENYAAKLFYFCLKKTGDSFEAEDLTSDILVNILSALQKGGSPANFPAWVWQIARNRYAAWAEKRRKERDAVTGNDIADYDVAGNETGIEDGMIREEQLTLLRRELAFISSDYRNILIAYYLENKRVRDIALATELPKGTVESKLHRARTILKEGMNMAREFGVRSYNPEDITFVNNCSAFGKFGQPWSILIHAIYKNIFLEAYGNPSTAEQLAMELGVALPYMEDELRYLTEQTFLVKYGDKYETDFPIISRDAQEKIAAKNEAFAAEITSLLERLLDTFHRACEKAGMAYYGNYVNYEDAKWTLLVRAFDWFRYQNDSRVIYRDRPDGGKWEVVGFQHTDKPSLPFVGQHGCFYTRSDLPEIDFSQFKYKHGGIDRQTPEHLSHEDGYALKLVAEGKSQECDQTALDNLLGYGYIRKDGENYVPNIMVFKGRSTDKYFRAFSPEEQAELSVLAEKITALFGELAVYSRKVTRNDLPPRLREDENLCALACGNTGFDRSDVLEQALKDGWLRYGKETSAVIGAYLVL